MNLVTGKQHISTGLTGVFLTFWLTLFSLHCSAGALPAGSQPDPLHGPAVSLEGAHAGMPAHTCHDNCKSVSARNEAALSRQVATAFSPQSPALPAALADCRNPESRAGPSVRAIPTPDGAVSHPLALTCVQLK